MVVPSGWICAADLRALLYRNGVIEETSVAAGVLNHPAAAWRGWRTKACPYDVNLKPGRSSAALFAAGAGAQGDTFHVDYGNMGAIGCAGFV